MDLPSQGFQAFYGFLPIDRNWIGFENFMNLSQN